MRRSGFITFWKRIQLKHTRVHACAHIPYPPLPSPHTHIHTHTHTYFSQQQIIENQEHFQEEQQLFNKSAARNSDLSALKVQVPYYFIVLSFCMQFVSVVCVFV